MIITSMCIWRMNNGIRCAIPAPNNVHGLYIKRYLVVV